MVVLLFINRFFLFDMTHQADTVTISVETAAKTPRMRIDAPPTFFNGCMTLKPDCVRPVVMTSGTGEDLTPGNATMEIGASRILSETEPQWVRIRRKIHPGARNDVGNAFTNVAITAKPLVMAPNALTRGKSGLDEMAGYKIALMSPMHRGIIRIHKIRWKPKFFIPVAVDTKLFLMALSTEQHLVASRRAMDISKITGVREFRERFQRHLLKPIVAVEAFKVIIPGLMTFKTELHGW